MSFLDKVTFSESSLIPDSEIGYQRETDEEEAFESMFSDVNLDECSLMLSEKFSMIPNKKQAKKAAQEKYAKGAKLSNSKKNFNDKEGKNLRKEAIKDEKEAESLPESAMFSDINFDESSMLNTKPGYRSSVYKTKMK